MSRAKRSSDDGSATAAAPALAANTESIVHEKSTVDEFCKKLAKTFQVQATEVAIFHLEDGHLKFLFPKELKTAGSIPLSSGSAIAAHTAVNRKGELYNSFATVKHASIFETVRLGNPDEGLTQEKPIQRLISAPVLDSSGTVLGVIQVCRKGYELLSSGPEFSLDDLHELERVAGLAAAAPFMQESYKHPSN
jgi:GAF domain